MTRLFYIAVETVIFINIEVGDSKFQFGNNFSREFELFLLLNHFLKFHTSTSPLGVFITFRQ